MLQLDRSTGIGRIKIDGANFGDDSKKVSVAIVPRDASLPAFEPVKPKEVKDPQNPYYVCPPSTPEEQSKPPDVVMARDDVVVVDFSFPL